MQTGALEVLIAEYESRPYEAKPPVTANSSGLQSETGDKRPADKSEDCLLLYLIRRTAWHSTY